MLYFLAISFIILIAVISSISDDPIKIYCDNSLCGEGPSGALVEFSVDVSLTDGSLTCEEKDNVGYNYSTDFYPTQYCIDVSNKCENNAKSLVEELVKQLQAISESFTHILLGVLRFYRGITLLHQVITQCELVMALLYLSIVIWRVVTVMVRESG